jgi:hypothetical protein
MTSNSLHPRIGRGTHVALGLAALIGCGEVAASRTSPADSSTAQNVSPDANSEANPTGATNSASPESPEASPQEAAGDVAAVDASPYCTVPLTPDAGPATLDDLPLANWCAQIGISGVSQWTTAYQGLIAVDVGATDCDHVYFFDASSRRLVAVLGGCNTMEVCIAGEPSFQCPSNPRSSLGDPGIQCVGFRPSFNVCAEAGLPPLPDGAGFACAQDSQCPAGYVCAYPAQSCPTSPGQENGNCLNSYDLSTQYPNCSPMTLCACDGTQVKGCVDSQGRGYFPRPVSVVAQPSTCRDGM